MTPFGTRPILTLDTARELGLAVEKHALGYGWKITVVIVDASATPLYVARMSDAILASYEGAYKKAVTALKFARPTKALEESVATGRLHYLAFEHMLCVEGGLPIIVEGTTIGGVGIGGGPSGREAAECARAGLATIGLSSNGAS